MSSPNSANPATQPSSGERPDQPQSLYAQVRGQRRKSRSAAWAMGLVVSGVLHLVVLFLLGLIRFGTPPEEHVVIEVDTDIIEEYRTEPLNVRSVINLDKSVSIADTGRKLAGKLGAKTAAVPVMGVDGLDLGGLDADLTSRRKTRGPAAWRRGDLTRKVLRDGEQDYKSAMDELARSIVKQIQKRSLLLVILFDGSRSLVKERELLSTQIERTFDELRFLIRERQEGRLRIAVAVFGKNATAKLKPTRKIKKVQDAIKKMPIEKSGEENVLKAIQFCLKNMRPKRGRMMILVLTDEQGDDVGLNAKPGSLARKALRTTVNLCRRYKVRVSILGREAYFQRAVQRYDLKDEKGVFRRGYQQLGWPTCRQELSHRVKTCRVANAALPSGFGCYTLSLLADRTLGQFFIISDKKALYKSKTLKPYRPEWCYPDEYDKRTKSSLLRTALSRIAREMPANVSSWHFFRQKGPWSAKQKLKWQKVDLVVKQKITWCDQKIRELKRLRKRARLGKARKRWEANADLTIAQLQKVRAMLMQYRPAVARFMRKRPPYPDKKKKKKADVIHYRLLPTGKPVTPDKIKGPSNVRRAIKAAQIALKLVIDRYPGTPWAKRAQLDLNDFAPIKAYAYWAPFVDPKARPLVGL